MMPLELSIMLLEGCHNVTYDCNMFIVQDAGNFLNLSFFFAHVVEAK
jgi:hypothetical protein